MWVTFALLSALFAATTDPLAKRALKYGDEYIVGWAILAFSTPFLALFCLLNKMAPFNIGLVKVLIMVVPLEILATVLYYRALKLTDISLSVPFLALTPIFSVLTAFFLLGERIGFLGIAGIAFITIGVYSLNLREARHGLAHPIKAILVNKGSLLMVLVAVIFSATSAMAKKAMLFSSPESIPFIYNLSISLVMAPLVLYRAHRHGTFINRDPRTILTYISLGLIAALSSVFYFKAVSLTKVAYAISIKRLSLLMSVGYGWLFFRERNIHIRFLSTLCMVFGVILILIGQ